MYRKRVVLKKVVFIPLVCFLLPAMVAAGNGIPETARNLLQDATLSGNIESLGMGLRGAPDHIIFDLQQSAFVAPSSWHEYGVGYQAELGVVDESDPVWWMAEWSRPVQVNLIALSGTYDNQPQPSTGWKIEFRREGQWIVHERGVGGWYDDGYYIWGGSGTEPLMMDALRVSVFSPDDETPITSVHFRGEAGQSWIAAYLSGPADNEDDVAFRHHVIFDTDANNEIDDQHALAYLLFNGDVFAVEGVTVNATSGPGHGISGHIDGQYDEAKRIMQLCTVFEDIPLYKGANGSFEEIKDHIHEPEFDGYEAVTFIIEQALKDRGQELILLPVGKLTNIALALLKEPAIAENVRIVWLGSNYPRPGEHNQNYDIPSMNYILDVDVPFEMVTVRYGQPSGTSAVRVTQAEILHRMPGTGPRISEPITGRHGGRFDNWGDYSVNLFEKYRMSGRPPGRPLFDQAAVAIIKNPDWAKSYEHPAPIFRNGEWVERPGNPRTITIWEWFDRDAIINDFFVTMENYVIAERP